MTTASGFAQSELSWGDLASGGHMTEPNIRKTLQGIKDIGFTRVRFGVQTGTWSDLDRAVNLSLEYGIKPLLCLVGNPVMGYAQSPEAYATFCSNVVNRYKDKVSEWEIFNEANSFLTNPHSGDPVVYTKYLKAAYTAIKAIQPVAASTVIVGGPIPSPTIPWVIYNPVDWYKGLYAAGAKPYFDAAGFHFYTDGPPTPSMPQWKYLTGLYDLMAASGDGGKKIWPTEVGVGSSPNAGVVPSNPTPQQAADWLKIMLDAVRAYPWCGPYYVYSYRNATPNWADSNSVYGAVDYNWVPKPQYNYLKSISGVVTPPAPPPPPPPPKPPWWAFWTWFR